MSAPVGHSSSALRLSGSASALHSADGRVPSPQPAGPAAHSVSASASSSDPASVLSSWAPQPAELQLVFTLLSDPLPGSAGSKSHYAQLDALKAYPEFSNYLAYILACCTDEAASTRAKAGLQLKNTVKEQWDRMSGAQQEYIKAAVIASMAADRGLQHVVGTILANIAVRCRIVGWPGILQHLVASLDSTEARQQLVAFDALSKICEDAGKELIKDDAALGKPLHYLIPKLIATLHHPKTELRVYSLTALNVFLYLMPLVMRMHLDAFLQAVFELAKSDDSPEVRRRVCRALVVLLENKNGHDRPLQPHMDGVINFMLHACNDVAEGVALEASEFWSAYCDTKGEHEAERMNGDAQLLAQYLQPLTATLLKGMRYSWTDINSDDDDDANVPDRQQDIRPNVHRGKTVNYEGAAAGGGGGGGAALAAHDSAAAGAGGEAEAWGDDDDDEDDDEDDDDSFFANSDDDEEVQNWNLRKCSASALDSLANTYGSLLFAHLLPLLKTLLSANPSSTAAAATPGQPLPEPWILRESAILALGAVAEGSFDAIMPHLPELIPYLLSFLTDKKPLVRSITCWTLSRYSKWVVTEPQQLFFQPLLEGLLASILDSNKKVQEAACSAFATFEEEAGMRLSEHLPRILSFLMHAFGKYQQKNMLILYDAIGTLAESVGDLLNQPACVQLLMPPLMQRWQQISDEDRAIFPLFECLGSVATALGEGFLPFAPSVFQRCLAIIQRTLDEQKAVEQRNAEEQAKGPAAEYEYVDLEFIVCALDLLSGMVEGLGAHIEPLVPQSPVLQLLYACMSERDPDVRQSAFALLGDLSKAACAHLLPFLGYFLPLCAINLNPHYSSVCNNASWAVGELAIKAGREPLLPHIDPLMRYLLLILLPPAQTNGGSGAQSSAAQSPRVSASLTENASITIGRLGLVCPQPVSVRLAEYGTVWFAQLERLRDNAEKEHAYHGMCSVVESNPTAVLGDLPALLSVVCGWQQRSNERMVARLTQLLHNFKQAFDGQGERGVQQWSAALQAVSDDKRRVLRSAFGVY